jgi:hypothetical protein
MHSSIIAGLRDDKSFIAYRIGMNWKARIMILVGGLVAGSLVNGCYSPEPPSLTSDSPPRLIPAIKIAASNNDRAAIPGLIQNLDDKDSAVRFAAISALRKMTGEDFGYRYYDCQYDRQPAIQGWHLWLKAHPS